MLHDRAQHLRTQRLPLGIALGDGDEVAAQEHARHAAEIEQCRGQRGTGGGGGGADPVGGVSPVDGVVPEAAVPVDAVWAVDELAARRRAWRRSQVIDPPELVPLDSMDMVLILSRGAVRGRSPLSHPISAELVKRRCSIMVNGRDRR